jgi:alanine or glycine:cation symporter, AGCS family
MSELIARIANEIYTPSCLSANIGGLFFLIIRALFNTSTLNMPLISFAENMPTPNDPGQINAYQALSTALASTVGMGNIAGVAAAISIGGPGAHCSGCG